MDDGNLHEMVEHCRSVLKNRTDKFKIRVYEVGSVFPVIRPGSVMLLRPVLSIVNTFPIREECPLEELECVDPRRPLYYCELRGKDLGDMMGRYRMSRGSRAMRRKKK